MRRRENGFSLLEVMIVAALLSLVAGALYATIFSSTTRFTNGTRMGSIQEDARLAMDALANEMRPADKKTFLLTGPTGGPNILTFNIPKGFDAVAGKIIWSTPIVYQLQASITDPSVMNLVRIQDGKTRRVCDWVKPGSFTVTRTGDNLTVTLTLTIKDEANKPLEAAVKTAVTLRNSS